MTYHILSDKTYLNFKKSCQLAMKFYYFFEVAFLNRAHHVSQPFINFSKAVSDTFFLSGWFELSQFFLEKFPPSGDPTEILPTETELNYNKDYKQFNAELYLAQDML